MAQILNRGKELIRISPQDSRKLDCSINDGCTWTGRFYGNASTGSFIDLTDNGKEILATTDKGLFYSINEGRTWNRRH